MRLAFVLGLASSIVIAVGAAPATSAPPVGDRVFGGGHRIGTGIVQAYFGVSARTDGSGARGNYAATFVIDLGGVPLVLSTAVEVTCLAVDGNRAVVGGVFRAPDASPELQHAFVWLEDNGATGDRVSGTAWLPNDAAFFPPEEFPSFPDPTVACPSPELPPPSPYHTMFSVAGNVTIVDGTP
ncbi:MAG: hypothetical protein WD689_02335 [Gaiellaceae bacterium]